MGSVDKYLYQIQENCLALDLNKVPDSAFFDVTKVRNLAKARIISSHEYAKYGITPGGNDILIMPNTGETQLISRSDFISQYKHTNGDKIKMMYLKNNTDYIVYSNSQSTYKATRVPNNIYIRLPNGKFSNKRMYVIAMSDESGAINRQSFSFIPLDIFKRQFIVPMQPFIEKIKAIKSGRSAINNFGNFNTNNDTDNKQQENLDFNKQHVSNNIVKPVSNIVEPVNSNVENNTQSKYRYTASARLVDNHDKLKGFVIKDTKTGNCINCNIQQTYQLCLAHKIDNIILVTKTDGSKYLRGNDISIEGLPKVIPDTPL